MSLADQLGGTEGDLLGVYRVIGSGSGGTASSSALRDQILRLSQPRVLRQCLECRCAEGFGSMLALSDAVLFEALGRRPAPSMPRMVPIAPNLRGFMREAVEHGMVGAGLRRAWRVGPVALAGMGVRGLGRIAPLARRDFPTMLSAFIELELADFKRYDPPLVFLQAQITDLALAMRSPMILESFSQAVARRTGAAAGLATYNFGHLMGSLKAWGLETAAILTPWEPGGGGMRPSHEACLKAARHCQVPIWGERKGSLCGPDPPLRAALTKMGLAGVVREEPALWSTE